MLKRIILLILIGITTAGIYYTVKTLQEKTQENLPILNCIPKDAAIILEINKPLKNWSLLSATNIIWNDLKNTPYFEPLDYQLKSIDSVLQSDSVLINSKIEKKVVVSIHPTTGTPNYLIAFHSSENIFNYLKEEHINGKKVNGFYKINAKSPLYITYNSPFIIIANKPTLLTKSRNQLLKKESLLLDSSFVKVRKTISKGSNIHIYTNSVNLKKLAIPFVKKEHLEKWKTFEKWTIYDMILKNNEIILNGISINRIQNGSYNSSHLINPKLLPPNISSINEYTINEKENSKIVEQINNDCNCDIVSHLDQWIGNHITEITFDKDLKAIFIPTKGASNTLKNLSEIVTIDTTDYQLFGKRIHRIQSSSFAQISNFPADEIYFYDHNSNLVFSSYKGLKQLLYYWQKTENSTIESFYSLFSKTMMAQKATTSHYTSLEYLAEKGLNTLKTEHKNTFSKNIDLLGNQIDFASQTNTLSANFTHHAIVIKSNPKTKNSTNEIWTIELKNKIVFGPQLVKNHKSNSLDIFVQDTTNTVFLINASGQIKWSKKLDGKIMNTVNQIDLFGNNKYQLVFNTPTKIYLLDINGNTTDGFPIQLPNRATSAVSVFDQNKDSDYRFWVSCDNNTTYNFTKEGKPALGWSAPNSTSLIVSSFQYFSLGNNHYFYTLDKQGKLYLLNNKGETVLKTDTTLNPKNGKLYFQKRASLLTSSLIYICDSTHKIKDYSLGNKFKSYNLDSNNVFAKIELIDLKKDGYLDYISFSQNKIEIYGPDKTLANRNDFMIDIEQSYSIVKSNKNKNYVVIQDKETQSLMILNANLTQLNSAKLTGSLDVGIGDMNANNKLNIVCRKNGNSIVAYRIE